MLRFSSITGVDEALDFLGKKKVGGWGSAEKTEMVLSEEKWGY